MEDVVYGDVSETTGLLAAHYERILRYVATMIHDDRDRCAWGVILLGLNLARMVAHCETSRSAWVLTTDRQADPR